jgi:glycosyltransferase involved in cell wall biosynthesis
MEKVSVVIPLYNKAPHIERAVRSVLAQTEQDFAIIVVDDGSNDGGAEVVKSISDPRIRIFRQDNQGVSVARNKGIELAQTDLIAFLDADDAYKPQFLETILRLRKKYPEAGAYSTAYEIIKKNGRTVRVKFKAIPPSPWEGIIPNYFKSALGSPPVCSSATAIPKYIFEKVGFFPLGEAKGEDLDMWLRIAVDYKMSYSTYVGAIYYQDSNKGYREYNRVPAELSVVKVIEKAILMNKIKPSSISFAREYINDLQLQFCSQIIFRSGEMKKAREIIRKCYTNKYFMKKMILSIISYLPYSLVRMLYECRAKLMNE